MIQCCGPFCIHIDVFCRVDHLLASVFWVDFAYAWPIYSDPERETIPVPCICKRLMISRFGAEACGSRGGHVFTGRMYCGERRLR